jgi:AraC family transcriptional activator of pobA
MMEIRHIDNLFDQQSASCKADCYQLHGESLEIGYSRRDFYKIWLIRENGKIIIAGTEIQFNRPTLIFLHPLLPYTFLSENKHVSGVWVIFTEAFLKTNNGDDNVLKNKLFHADQPSVLFLDEADFEVVNFFFKQIICEYRSGSDLKFSVIRNYINLLIFKGLELNPLLGYFGHHNAASRITANFINLLESQYPVTSPKQPLRLRKPKDFADVLAVHVNHLNAVVREITLKATRDHIASRVIAESKVLLQFSDWSISDIAYSLGFNYPNHFNNFFKKYTGTNPRALRK